MGWAKAAPIFVWCTNVRSAVPTRSEFPSAWARRIGCRAEPPASRPPLPTLRVRLRPPALPLKSPASPCSDPHEAMMGVRYFGAAVPRIEDPDLVAGRGRFLDDIDLPGMTHAAF